MRPRAEVQADVMVARERTFLSRVRLWVARRLAPFRVPLTIELDCGSFDLSVTRGAGEVELHT